MYMKYLRVTLLLLAVTSLGYAQVKKGSSYNYIVDLTRVVDDKVYVELKPPSIKQAEIVFYLPKIIPGTYAIEDYGRFVSEFSAMDKKGSMLPVERLDSNSWKIKSAKKLAKITYWIEDSYDTKLGGASIFQPAGTNIEEGKNFILNPSGFLGYFDGMKEVTFNLNVVRPADFYGSTGLIATQTGKPISTINLEKGATDNGKQVDTYETEDYDHLVDSPLMFSKPDTAVIKVGNAEVLVGSYSPNGKITAKEIAGSLKELLMAQQKFLGGTLPVNKYAFLFYFSDEVGPGDRYGALEHSYSSMYFMPNAPIAALNQNLRDIAAHEFFHIVTPLTVHSKEIDDFNFNDPKMSQHLWMYEGVTEYFASNVQVKYGLMSPEDYLQVIREKLITADNFRNDLSFTDLSKFTLDKYHDQYDNVYYKGMLIGLCLDIKLRKLSSGKSGVKDLILGLSKKYGKNTAFEDNELFDVITKMTYPEIGDFLNRFVKGSEPLPISEALRDVGVNYLPSGEFEDYSLGISQGNLGVAMVDGKQKLQIADTAEMNAMGKALGFRQGDIIAKMNGAALPDLENNPEFGGFIQAQIASLPQLKTLTYTVLRKDEAGAEKEVELSAPVQTVKLTEKHILAFDPAATPEQLQLRTAWLQP